MASTRIRNLPGDYAVRKRINSDTRNYQTSRDKAYAYKTYFPAVGVNVGQLPNYMSAVNQTDVDSFLKGQYFNNLEKPKDEFTADVKSYSGLSFFPRDKLIMPNPLVIENCQRPYRYAPLK